MRSVLSFHRVIFLLALMTLLALPTVLPGQAAPQSEEAVNEEPERKYLLKLNMPVGVKHKYKYTERTRCKRQYHDSSKRTFEYTRVMTYFISAYTPGSPDDGFKTVYYNIDSMRFEMDDGVNELIEYDSQSDANANLNQLEVLAATVPLNRAIYLTYSPYGEVVKMESDDLDFLKDYLNDGGDTVLPALDYFLWWDRMDIENFKQIVDISHNILPERFIQPDDVWERPISMRVDGISFRDTADASVASFEHGIYRIVAKSDDLQPLSKRTYMYGHSSFCQVIGGTGTSETQLRFSRLGVMGEATRTLNAQIEVKAEPYDFSAEIQSTQKLELLGRFEW